MNSVSEDGRSVGQQNNLRFLAVLLGLSLCLNVVLGWRIHAIRNAGPTSSAPTGMLLSPFMAVDLGGAPHVISFAGESKPTVLYVLNPGCHWCARNLANIKTLATQRSSDFTFIGISLKDPDLKQYATAINLQFPIYFITDYNIIPALQLGGTPQTIVIGTDGRVWKNWIGAFGGETANEISAYFKIALPGLLPDEPAVVPSAR